MVVRIIIFTGKYGFKIAIKGEKMSHNRHETHSKPATDPYMETLLDFFKAGAAVVSIGTGGKPKAFADKHRRRPLSTTRELAPNP